MTGINHRRKNPIQAASSSRATKVEQLRRSYRALQKKAYPSRIAQVRGGGIREVMGRVVAVGRGAEMGDSANGSARQRGSVANEFGRGGKIDATNPGSTSGERCPLIDSPNPRVTGRLTVDELLQEDNLAGLPERYRARFDDPHVPHRSSTGDYGRDGEDDMLEEMTEGDPDKMEAIEGGSDTSEDPLMIHPTRRHSFDVASVAREEERLSHSRQASSLALEIETPYEHPPYPLPESVAAPLGEELFYDQQVDPRDRPESSESGWEEAGTLSSHDDDFAMDFDEDRDGFSDAGEDEQMLDCSDGEEEEACRLLPEDAAEGGGPEGGLGESASMIDHTIAAFEQEMIAHTACGGEVSRFFNSTTGAEARSAKDAAGDSRIASDVTADDPAVGTWYRSASVLGHATITSEQVTTGRSSGATPGIAQPHVDNQVLGTTATRQDTSDFLVTEHTRETRDNLSDKCNRYLVTQPEELHPANSGIDARPVSPQDSGLGPFPGDFASHSPSAKDLDDMFEIELATPPPRQSKAKTKGAKADFADLIVRPKQQARIIPYSDSSPSPVEISRKANFQICASVERGPMLPSHLSSTSTFNARSAAMAHLSVASRQPNSFADPTSIYRWDQPFASAKQALSDAGDSGIESFGSDPGFGRDIEAEAFDVLSEKTHVNTSGEETAKEDDEEEAMFNHRLSRNVCRDDTPLTMWRIAQWHQHTDHSEAEHYRQYDPDNEREAYQRLDHPRRRSERLAGNASRSDWPPPWMKNWKDEAQLSGHIRRSLRNAPSEEWEVVEDSPEMDLELLGEDGLPYVFEVVSANSEGIEDKPHLPSDTTDFRAGGGNGILLDVAANPFLEEGISSEDHANPNPDRNLPTFDQVVVVYNYSSAATVSDGPGSGAEESAPRKEYDEEAILQEVRDYLGKLVRMLAEDMEG